MSSIQGGGRPGAPVTVRGSTIVPKGVLWVRTVLGSLLGDTYVLLGKILESCSGIGDSKFLGPGTVLTRGNVVYKEYLMVFLVGNHLSNSCRGRRGAKYHVQVLPFPCQPVS